MSSLKQSIFLVASYLAAIFILAQFDYTNSPIIDFAKYFYFAVMVAVPATVFIPNITRVNVAIPIVLWGCVYLVMLQVLDRSVSAPNSTFPIILLEFVLFMIGIWLAYQLAEGSSPAESILDAMAISAFPNRVRDIQEATRQVKLEIARSRRYYRPLCLIVFSAELSLAASSNKIFINIQHDLTNRFSLARMSQIIDEHVRQTDMVFRDSRNRFIILCPETNYDSCLQLSLRIGGIVKDSAGAELISGAAAFPDDALNFDDLMEVARHRMENRRAEALESKNSIAAQSSNA